MPVTVLMMTPKKKHTVHLKHEVVEPVSTQVEPVSTQVDSVETQVESVETQVETVSTQVEPVETQVESVETVSTQVETVEIQVEPVEKTTTTTSKPELSSMQASEDEDDDDDNAVLPRRMPTSSHDLLAGLLLAAMHRSDADLNAQRRIKQIAITDRFITELERIGERLRGQNATPIAEVQRAAYLACQQFTADYIHAFDDPGHPAATMQFMRMEEVPRHSHVHSATCSWNAAQDIQHAASVDQRRTAAHFARMEYPALIVEHLMRVTARE
jgi:hypothetical protein